MRTRDILGRLELVACVAIAAGSPSVRVSPYRSGADGEVRETTPTEWAEHIVRHGEALRKTFRWAWAARLEDE